MGLVAKLSTRPVEAVKVVVVWCAAALLAWYATPTVRSFAVGASLILAGLLVRGWAAGHLRRNQELATSGPYAYLRDPLYLGRLLLLIGLGVTANNPLCYGFMGVALLAFFVDYMPRKLRKETARLEDRFGEQYVNYRRAVRSLIPRVRPYEASASRRWSFAIFWRENREHWFILGTVLLVALAVRSWFDPAVCVSALVETEPVESRSADDPAIWVHPTRPELSVVIGTDKGTGGGLRVYDLAGKVIQFVSGAGMNNVDVRYGFLLGGKSVDLVAATNVQQCGIDLFTIDPKTRTLSPVAARKLVPEVLLTGCCLYRSAKIGKFYFFGNSLEGGVEQWELFDNGAGKVDATRVRSFQVGSRTEGCVADDELGRLYVSEERVGIWRYDAEPDAEPKPTLVERAGKHLTPDVEGLAIYCTAGGDGYLIASSQGSDRYVVYRRGGANEYVATFRITAGDGIDGAEDTDGIDVVNVPLGPNFPKGLFVAHDGRCGGQKHRTNFKLVPWERIAGAVTPPLRIDTSRRPRP